MHVSCAKRLCKCAPHAYQFVAGKRICGDILCVLCCCWLSACAFQTWLVKVGEIASRWHAQLCRFLASGSRFSGDQCQTGESHCFSQFVLCTCAKNVCVYRKSRVVQSSLLMDWLMYLSMFIYISIDRCGGWMDLLACFYRSLPFCLAWGVRWQSHGNGLQSSSGTRSTVSFVADTLASGVFRRHSTKKLNRNGRIS